MSYSWQQVVDCAVLRKATSTARDSWAFWASGQLTVRAKGAKAEGKTGVEETVQEAEKWLKVAKERIVRLERDVRGDKTSKSTKGGTAERGSSTGCGGS